MSTRAADAGILAGLPIACATFRSSYGRLFECAGAQGALEPQHTLPPVTSSWVVAVRVPAPEPFVVLRARTTSGPSRSRTPLHGRAGRALELGGDGDP